MNIPNFEMAPFDPNRTPETAVPKQERGRILYEFPIIYNDAIWAEYLAGKGDVSKRRVAAKQGQMAGKMFLRMIEGAPVDEQIREIIRLDKGIQRVHEMRRIPLNGFCSGFMTEFATGVMLKDQLDVRYPKTEDDLRHQTDFTAFLADGREVAIQSTTIPFLHPITREGLGQPNWQDRIPIFSPLRDEQEYIDFRNSLLENARFSEKAQAHLSDVLGEAKKFQGDALKRGIIPLFCLLGSPGSASSDIIQTTYRPTRGAANQARRELQNFIETT